MFKKRLKIEENILEIVINNDSYLEINDFLDGIEGIKNEYALFLKDKCGKEDRDNKLYLKEVKKGSIILQIIEEIEEHAEILKIATEPVLIDFTKYLIKLLDFYSFKTEEIQENIKQYSLRSINNVKKIFNFCSNNKGNINFTLINNNKTIITQNYNYLQANAAQNMCEKTKKDNVFINYDCVSLELYQLRNIDYSNTGTMGIIKSINDKPKKIEYDDEEIRKQIMNFNENPFDYIFNVDVDIFLRDANKSFSDLDNIKFYKITKLNGIFKKTEQLELPID